MKIGDYIIAEDWNSLSASEKNSLANYLEFCGFCHGYPLHCISPRRLVHLTEYGLFESLFMPGRRKRITLDEVRRLISLDLMQ